MSRKIFLVSIILILTGIFLAWEIYLPKNSLSQEKVIFRIAKGEGSKEIALNLEREGLIKWDLPFRIYVLIRDVSGNLQAGTYELSPSMTIPWIAQKFASGDTLKIKVTVPEGFNLKEIQARLMGSGVLKEEDLEKLKTADFKNEFDFLKSAPDNASLEGFLFPDTYFFEPNENNKEICVRFLENFERKIASYQPEISVAGKKFFEIIIMASLLEKEVRTKEDKEFVSGILWKRLENKMPLQVDATISYIKKTTSPEGAAVRPYGVKISIEETKIDSPYNTYKYLGLPAGPIANPGLESILAALYPKDREDWYYLSTPEGQTIFNKTLEGHNKAKAEYLK